MPSIRCLYVEDDQHDFEVYSALLTDAWDELKTGLVLDIVRAEGFEDAQQHIKNLTQEFGLVVMDVLLGEEAFGLQLTGLVRRIRPKTPVLAVSRVDQVDAKKIEDAGAVAFVSKKLLMKEPGLAPLVDKLRGIVGLVVGGSGAGANIQYDPKNLPLRALVEQIGTSTIGVLLGQLAERRVERATLEYLAPGFSGAVVMRATCLLAGDVSPPPRLDLLLKLSRDHDLLKDELSRTADSQSFPSGIFIRYSSREVVSCNGWSGICGGFLGRAETLSSWLSDDRSPSAVGDVLSQLCLEGGLKDVYQHAASDDGHTAAETLWSHFSLSRRARVAAALHDLHPLVIRFLPRHETQFMMGQAFARDEEPRVSDRSLKSFPTGARVCLSHGDLHGRNILLENGKHAYLIDPASITRLHWSMDLARLIVDLLVTPSKGNTDAFDWAHIEPWLKVVGNIVRGKASAQLNGSGISKSVGAASRWLRTNAFAIHSNAVSNLHHEWEFLLGLSVEFLRASYRIDLPPTRKVATLIAGGDALELAAQLAPR